MFGVDFKKHLKALLWNGGMLSLAFFLDYVAKNLGMFDLSEVQTMVLGLVLARVSKEINTRITK